MNIQIFGTKKCNDTKKAERYYKERGIKFQFIDMSEKGISKGEFRSVCQAVGGLQAMINEDCKDKDALALVKHITDEQKEEKLGIESGTAVAFTVLGTPEEVLELNRAIAWEGIQLYKK